MSVEIVERWHDWDIKKHPHLAGQENRMSIERFVSNRLSETNGIENRIGHVIEFLGVLADAMVAKGVIEPQAILNELGTNRGYETTIEPAKVESP